MLKSVTPTTPISIALFAGSNDNLEIIKLRKSDNLRNNDDLNSDSEYDDIRSDLKNGIFSSFFCCCCFYTKQHQ